MGLRFVMSQTSFHILSRLARFASLAQLCDDIAASKLRVGLAWLLLARVALVSAAQVGHGLRGHGVGIFNAKKIFKGKPTLPRWA